jgi:hypothetical protein
MPVAARASGKNAPKARNRSSGRGGEFLHELEERSRGIRDPVAKLRYLRSTLARRHGIDADLTRVPDTPLRLWLTRAISVEGLRRLLVSNPLAKPALASRDSRRYVVASRAVAGLAVLALAIGISGGAHALLRGTEGAAPLSTAAPAAEPSLDLEAQQEEADGFVPKGVEPKGIWCVERGDGWELYSNGLRIESSYAVVGEPRRYRVFEPGRGMGDEVLGEPAGILFHTSESDIWPLDAAFNENLVDSSQRLLKYLRRNNVYHYLIDRFGQAFRVVDEGSKANHAGHSIWAVGDRVYLNLNHAFLGISFETRWEGGHALPITQAQFAAGRNLTDYLRHRYGIAAEMCVTHGLTSVNPYKHLIGHHLDWARGFPFEAFGLPDHYRSPPPSVAMFGFGYDDHFLEAFGKPWEGVRAAEETLGAEARARGRTVEDVRRERQATFDVWLAAQEEDRRSAAAAASRRGPDPGRSGVQTKTTSGGPPDVVSSGARAATTKLRHNTPARRPQPGVGPQMKGIGG